MVDMTQAPAFMGGRRAEDLSPEEQVRRIQIARAAGGDPSVGISPFENVFERAVIEGGLDAGNTRLRAISTTSNLASQIVDEFLAQTGKLPTEDEVAKLLGETINTGFAAKTLTGGISEQTFRSMIAPSISRIVQQKQLTQEQAPGQADPYEEYARGIGEERQRALEKQTEYEIGRAGEEAAVSYGQERKRALEEGAALGRYGQPNYARMIAEKDAEQGRVLSDIIASLRNQSLGLGADIKGQTLANVLAGKQFGSQLGLQKQQLLEQGRQFDVGTRQASETLWFEDVARKRREQLARELGAAQAEAMSPGTLDYLNTAFQGLGALTGLGGGIAALGNVINQPSSGRVLPRANVTPRRYSSTGRTAATGGATGGAR